MLCLGYSNTTAVGGRVNINLIIFLCRDVSHDKHFLLIIFVCQFNVYHQTLYSNFDKKNIYHCKYSAHSLFTLQLMLYIVHMSLICHHFELFEIISHTHY